MTLTPSQLGFLRGIGSIVIMAVLTFLGDSANLNGVVSATIATIISGLAVALEHAIEAKTGRAGFGSVALK